MSSEFSLKVPRASDRTLVAAYRDVAKAIGISAFSATAVAGIEMASFPEEKEQENVEPWASLLKQNSALMMSMHLRKSGMTIAFSRGTRAQNSAIFDEVVISYRADQGTISDADRLQVVAILSKKLRAFDPSRSLQSFPTDEANQLDALHQSTLDRLEQLAEDVIRRTTDTHLRLEEDYFAKKLAVEQDGEKVKSDLIALHEAAMGKLLAQEQELAQRQTDIDDRDNTHVRREMRNGMLDDVRQRIQDFGVSKKTEDKRQPVSLTLLALLCLLMVLVAYTLWEIQSFYGQIHSTNGIKTVDGTDVVRDLSGLYFMWTRLSILSAGFFFTALYYVRWHNRWAEQHSLAEFQLQQFYIDVNRANWVIESGLEWRKETSTEMPEAILTSVTKNLFRAHDEPPPALHPADELASALLGSASKLKVKNGDSEIEFDKPAKIPN